MPSVQRPTRDELHQRAFALERRGQVRGLLVLAALLLGWIVYRALPLGFFHAGWWRP